MKLVFPNGEHPQALLGTGINRIGSDPGADIVLDGPGVLPQHCTLQVAASGVTVDIARGTSVSVNTRPVTGVIALRPGDTLAIGHVVAKLVSLGRDAAGAPHHAVENDVAATTVRPALPMLVLRGVTGGVFGRSYAVRPVMTVGSAPGCDIAIERAGISGVHARLTTCVDGVEVEDLHSATGTFVNGRRVRRYTARLGDEIGFDTARFRLTGTGSESFAPPGALPDQAVPVQALRRSVVWPVALGTVLAVAAFLARDYLLR